MSYFQNKRSIPKEKRIPLNGTSLPSKKAVSNILDQNCAKTKRKGPYARKAWRQIKKKKFREDKLRVYNSNVVLDVFSANFKMEELCSSVSEYKEIFRGLELACEIFEAHWWGSYENNFTCVFNIIWASGCVPAQFKRTVVIPVLKKDKDSKQLHSYHPYLLPAYEKIKYK